MQNRYAMRPEVRAEHDRAVAALDGDQSFRVRLERWFTELRDPFFALYGHDPRCARAWETLLATVARAAAERPQELRVLDHERELTQDWLAREQSLGYVAYVDRFAGTLNGIRERLPYLRELGITYLHLMPLLAMRPEPNDGGYAVVDYGAVEPRLGTIEDLRALATDLRAAGIALCVDVVLNHTAAEHPWTQDPSRYLVFEDRSLPDTYERTLSEAFPATAPGNFTEGDGRWWWTTFNAYQRDLDWGNPEVFVAMAAEMLALAQAGVDVFRLDAVPFLWKRLGTRCQNEPEVHEVLQALRAVFRIAAPAVAFKAEAIVSPRELSTYLGTGKHEGKECEVAYHNVLMVLLWSSLASTKVRLMTEALRAIPAPPHGSSWVTYVRCHDDIGWAITDEDAGRVGEDAHLHRLFLSSFYTGEFPGSYARGERFQLEPESGESRISGSCASLAGLSAASDEASVELAVRRILLLYAMVFAHGGLPLIYMGDELGLLNDPAAAGNPDNRWIHRPFMDWSAADRRGDPASIEGRIWGGLQRLAAVRRSSRAFHADGRSEPVDCGNEHVFGLVRELAGDRWLVLGNFSSEPQWVGVAAFEDGAAYADGRPLERAGDGVRLAPYQHLWIRR